MFEGLADYRRDAIRFFRSPRIFSTDVDFDTSGEAKTSRKYLGFAFLFTSALVVIELKLIPEELTGSAATLVKKDEVIFSYWILILVFALLLHSGCRLLSGRGSFRATRVGLFRTYSFLIPATTLGLIIMSVVVDVLLGTYWLVTPPLGVIGLEPFEPTTAHILLMAGFTTIYFYMGLFFSLCTLWTLHGIHKISYPRIVIAVGVSLTLLVLIQPLIVQVTRPLFDLFEPLFKPFL